MDDTRRLFDSTATFFTHNWTIEGFQYLYCQDSNGPGVTFPSFIQSDNFSLNKDEDKYSFFLRVHPQGRNQRGEHLSLHLHMVNADQGDLEVACRFALIDHTQRECISLSKFGFFQLLITTNRIYTF